MKARKLNHIHDRLRGKPHLKLIETNVVKIPERLEQYDSNLFLVFNAKKQQYEVHSLANRGSTYCITVPYEDLDYRTIELFAKGNIRTRGIKAIIREMDMHNETIEKRREKHRKSNINAMAREMRPVFKKMAEEVY